MTKSIARFVAFSLFGPMTFAAHPNILFIAIDDMRDSTDYSGSTQAKTPNLDRPAKSGAAFRLAYIALALCHPCTHMNLLRVLCLRVLNLSGTSPSITA